MKAVELLGVRLSVDGRHLRLQIRDDAGQAVFVSLPTGWLNAMLSALPRCSSPDKVHPLDSWSMDHAGKGNDLILTLRTPEGNAVSFAVKPWQIEGMATIATYGTTGRGSVKTVH